MNNLFRVYPSEKLNLYEVSAEVNKVLFDNPTCIKRLQTNTIIEEQLSLF